MFTDRVVYNAEARKSEEMANMMLRKYPANHYQIRKCFQSRL